jgi:hypothetical protein
LEQRGLCAAARPGITTHSPGGLAIYTPQGVDVAVVGFFLQVDHVEYIFRSGTTMLSKITAGLGREKASKANHPARIHHKNLRLDSPHELSYGVSSLIVEVDEKRYIWLPRVTRVLDNIVAFSGR